MIKKIEDAPFHKYHFRRFSPLENDWMSTHQSPDKVLTRDYDLDIHKYSIKRYDDDQLQKAIIMVRKSLAVLQCYIRTKNIPMCFYDVCSISIIFEVMMRHYLSKNLDYLIPTGIDQYWDIKLIKCEKKYTNLLKRMEKESYERSNKKVIG